MLFALHDDNLSSLTVVSGTSREAAVWLPYGRRVAWLFLHSLVHGLVEIWAPILEVW